MAKETFFVAKVLAKDYIYCIHSVQYLCLEACFAGREDGHGNQKHIDFCSSPDISRALGIL